MLSRLKYLSLASIILASSLAINSPAFAQAYNVPTSYIPHSSISAISGSASAPITLTIKRKLQDDTQLPPAPDTFNFAVTGKDLDTWIAQVGGTQSQFNDTLFITSGTEDYPITGPIS